MGSLGRGEWVRLIGEYETGDLRQREFAASHNVSLYTLRFWLYKLRLEAKNSPRFLPVEVVASTAPTARESRLEWIEARLPSGIRFRFHIGTDSRYLAELFAALA